MYRRCYWLLLARSDIFIEGGGGLFAEAADGDHWGRVDKFVVFDREVFDVGEVRVSYPLLDMSGTERGWKSFVSLVRKLEIWLSRIQLIAQVDTFQIAVLVCNLGERKKLSHTTSRS